MLDKAEQRNKALGLSTAKMPLAERNVTDVAEVPQKQHTYNKTPKKESTGAVARASPKQKLRKRSTERSNHTVDAKDNADLSVEINITTGPNVQVGFRSVAVCIVHWLLYLASILMNIPLLLIGWNNKGSGGSRGAWS